jgi:hypothetical protein
MMTLLDAPHRTRSLRPLNYPRETRCDVAALARSTVRALMRIVGAMTINTGGRRRHLGDILADVTGLALQSRMGAREREFCLPIVIERPSRPGIGIVA